MSNIEPQEFRLRDGSTAVVIRSACQDDAERLVALYREVVSEGPWTLIQDDEFSATADSHAREIDRYSKDTGSIYLVACKDSHVVGTARIEGGVFRRTMHCSELHSLWIDRMYRRLGVADALVQSILTWARASEQIEKLFILVFSTNEAAVALYKKHGFVVEGRGVHDMKFENGSYADTVVLGHFLCAEE